MRSTAGGRKPAGGWRAHLDRSSVWRARASACLQADNHAGVCRCRIDGDDLTEMILAGGGARAAPDVSADLQARSARLGRAGYALCCVLQLKPCLQNEVLLCAACSR